MATILTLGRLAGLRVQARISALLTFAGLWALCTLGGMLWLERRLGAALLLALLVLLVHWMSCIVHHLGHGLAAQRTGYPMQSIELWGPLATSRYPADEPQLSALVHRRRAVGGPLASTALAALFGLLAFVMYVWGSAYWWMAAWGLLDNLLSFSLGALLPLGFTDGSTLRMYPRQR